MAKILQISDTHIVGEGTLAYDTVDTAAALAQTVATINRLLPQIRPVDLVIVTGDLTEHGTDDEYDRFREIMAPLQLPYRVVPGNHDRRDPLRRAFAADGWAPQSGPINWVSDLGDLAVIALDSLQEGRAAGLLADDTLAFLDEALKTLGGKPAVVGFHHPPFAAGIEAMDRQNLHNADALFSRLEGYPGEVTIACGHLHRAVTTLMHGRLCQIAPGTSHAVTLDERSDTRQTLTMEPGGMVLHETRDGRIVSHVIPVGHYPGPYPFLGIA